MNILLIGNFAPPFEEENLHNITLYNRLVEDGDECTVINISKHPAKDPVFINPNGYAGYLLTLLRLAWKKDVIHFSTKGYLRVGLLKMMLSIFVAKIFRAKSIVTFHSEFFSILGQMRSPFGGTQTLNTSFYLADSIIFADKDTYDVATMYQKRANFELVPSFIHTSHRPAERETPLYRKLKDIRKVIVFTNIVHDSFLFEILKEMIKSLIPSEDAVLVISLSGGSSQDLKKQIEASSGEIKDRLIFIEQDDVQSALSVFSRADVVLRPLTCDGEMFFEKFTVSVRNILHEGNTTFFPNSLVFIKEGNSAVLCANIVKTISSYEDGTPTGINIQDPYERIRKIYGQ
ncbi:MAG: hypothetical protein HZC49_13890 [Nitrospirae bacterium]|nr:hypothetical protein [Nitrospirota bacterium]